MAARDELVAAVADRYARETDANGVGFWTSLRR
jgi:hypothetical protein